MHYGIQRSWSKLSSDVKNEHLFILTSSVLELVNAIIVYNFRALIDISRLPMDFTQRIEIELNGKRPKPRLLLLATLTGLTKAESTSPYLPLPAINIVSSGESFEHQSDTETNNFPFMHRRISRNSFTEITTPTSSNDEWTHPVGAQRTVSSNSEQMSLEETDAQIIENYVSSLLCIFFPDCQARSPLLHLPEIIKIKEAAKTGNGLRCFEDLSSYLSLLS